MIKHHLHIITTERRTIHKLKKWQNGKDKDFMFHYCRIQRSFSNFLS